MAMPPPPRQPARRILPWVIGAVVVLAVAAVVVSAIGNNSSNSNNSPTIAAPAATTAGACDVTSVAKRELPSVVTIQAGSGGTGGVGSGEVIRSAGYILTNNHVIAPAVGGGALHVLFDDGSSAPATLVGRDPLTDLAVIKVSGKSNLRTISIGDSSSLQIGQPVVALGAPLGLSSTVTSGIVSALGRTVHVPGEGSQNAVLVEAVQTDAAINPGNSGGALVNCSGALVGIPTAGASTGESGGSIGLGFAIPANSALQIADELISTGSVTHAFIGVQAQPLTAAVTGQAGAGEGLWVTAVTPGGPAAGAGLQAGDIIREIDGKPAVSTDQLVAVTLTKRPGEQVSIKYERDGREATATVTLGGRPSTS